MVFSWPHCLSAPQRTVLSPFVVGSGLWIKGVTQHQWSHLLSSTFSQREMPDVVLALQEIVTVVSKDKCVMLSEWIRSNLILVLAYVKFVFPSLSSCMQGLTHTTCIVTAWLPVQVIFSCMGYDITLIQEYNINIDQLNWTDLTIQEVYDILTRNDDTTYVWSIQ